jgi:hypothetical protein
MAQQTIWNGTDEEARRLMRAIERNCNCSNPLTGPGGMCAPHRMILEDQRALDGLLFARRIVARLTDEERLKTVRSPATDRAT